MKKLLQIKILLIKALIFILPVFFLPLTSDYFEFNKQIILWLIVPLILLAKFIESALDRKLSFFRTKLDKAILVYFVIALLAAIFSSNTFVSIFGNPGVFSGAFLGILNLVIFYFLVIDLLSKEENKTTLPNLINIFLYSYLAVLVFSLLDIFGLFKLIPFGKSLASFHWYLAGGSFEKLTVFVAVVSSLLGGLILFNSKTGRWSAMLSGFLWIFSLPILVLFNYQPAWIIYASGIIFSLIFYFFSPAWKLKAKGKIINVLMIIIVSVSAFLLSGIIPPDLLNTSSSVKAENIGKKEAIQIAKKVIAEKTWLGVGTGNFAYAYSLYRPNEMNQSADWKIRYDHGPSPAINSLVEGGLLVSFGYLLLIVYFLFLMAGYLRSADKNRSEYGLTISLAAAFLGINISFFLFEGSTVLFFCFWLFLALLVSQWKSSSQKNNIFEFDLSSSDKAEARIKVIPYPVFLVSMSVIFLAWFYLNIMAIRIWTADLMFNLDPNDEKKVMQSVALNPYREEYKLNLSKIYFGKAKSDLLKTVKDRNEEELKNNIDLSLNWGKIAIKTNLNNIAAREHLGMIYRDLAPYVSNSEEYAIIYFKEARKLEPSNPVLPVEIGKLYLKQGQIEEAEALFKDALDLKKDYHEAEFYLAKTYSQSGRESDALQYLVSLSAQYKDPEIYFELGRIYYNQGITDQAIKYFEKVLVIVPNHANSLYSLGLAYENSGDNKKALEYFNQALKLNPANEDLIKRIKILNR